jgi:hypothetical protein
MIRRPAKVRNRNDAKGVEREHRRALSLGQVHPTDLHSTRSRSPTAPQAR